MEIDSGIPDISSAVRSAREELVGVVSSLTQVLAEVAVCNIFYQYQ